MNKILIILSLVLLASCGPSQEDKETIAAVTCSIIGETRGMDAAIRVREMNDARVKIGGEPFLRGDDAIKESLEWGLCKELVLNESYDETLQSLKDANREMERIAAEKRAEENRIAAEKQRIADTKPSVREQFWNDGILKSRRNYQPKSDGGKLDGLNEFYWSNGKLWSKYNYKDGEKDGLYETYYDNGQLAYKANFKDGKLDGLEEYYDENGQLKLKTNYKDGERDGILEIYHENGQLKSKGNYKDGKEID